MIANPSIGMWVQVWYAEKKRAGMPHHGRIGMVVVWCCRIGWTTYRCRRVRPSDWVKRAREAIK